MAIFAVLFEGEGELGDYQVVDCMYGGRPARVLYSGNRLAAQSGMARDGKSELLFDYNQRFLELVRGVLPKRLLLIGGGAFTLPKALMDEFPRLSIDVVEPDAKLLDIAQAYFDFKPSKRTRIYHDNGRNFLTNSTAAYDVIIIDAFENTEIPLSLQTAEAARSLRQHLRPRGIVAINVIAVYSGERSRVLRRVTAAFQDAFTEVQIFPASPSFSLWTPQNFICVGHDGKQAIEPFMRYAAEELPAIEADDLMHDA
jgi:predicted membrane-bound spermidine synthase